MHKRVCFPLQMPIILTDSLKHLGPVATQLPRNSLLSNPSADCFVRFKGSFDYEGNSCLECDAVEPNKGIFIIHSKVLRPFMA
jgi:hypothetical protein